MKETKVENENLVKRREETINKLNEMLRDYKTKP